MSSTTDGARGRGSGSHRSERGQVVVIFAAALTALIALAALAFDTGTVVVAVRRQQDAADAAALAGARFLPADAAKARTAARDIAARNGYTAGSSTMVTVNVPPASGPYANNTSFIEVRIGASVPSVFARIFGRESWSASARSVAANVSRRAAPFALLALDPAACPGLAIAGQGTLSAKGNVQVDSACTTGSKAFNIGGNGTVVAAPNVACNVVGTFQKGGGVTNNCPVNQHATSIPDPLAALAYPSIPVAGSPPVPVYPTAPHQVGGTPRSIAAGCPGSSSPASQASPAVCRFTSSFAGTTWRFYPGYYPGGIVLEGGTFYLEPGVYYLQGACLDGGGGTGPVSLRAAGAGVNLTSVASGGAPPAGGGVLFFNAPRGSATSCQGGTAYQDGAIDLEGNTPKSVILPISGGTAWDAIVIFQHRSVTRPVTIKATSALEVRGIIYAPTAQVIVQGGNSALTVDQIIAGTFNIQGGGGSINAAYDLNYLPHVSIAGLVE